MPRLRLSILSLLALLAISAVAAASSQAECLGNAPEKKCIWELANVAGMFAPLNAEEEEILQVSQATTFKLVAGADEVKCTNIASHVTLIGGARGKDITQALSLTGCTTNSATMTCKVKSSGKVTGGEIIMTNIKTELREDENMGGTVKNILADRFEQKLHRGTREFATLEFGTTEAVNGVGLFQHRTLTTLCAGFPASTKIKGHVEAEVEGGEKLKFPTPALKQSSLEAFGVVATLSTTGFAAHRYEPGEYRGV